MTPLVVIGDALLDVDVEGNSHRLCPEAPVPVVESDGEWLRPGGAGLAAALLARKTPPEVLLVTALGPDENSRRLSRLPTLDIPILRLPLHGQTPCKTRIRAAGHSLARVDTGDGRATPAPLPAAVRRALPQAGTILVSDYGRGVADHPELRQLLTSLAPRVPIVWDPHPRGPAPVPGATLVTPNAVEATDFTQGVADPAEAARQLRRAWSCSAVAITTGAHGSVLVDAADEVSTVPVPATAKVAAHRLDTCGAGDRFAGAAATALQQGASLPTAVHTAVEAAARFISAGGATALSVNHVPQPPADPTAFDLADRVRRQGSRLVATGGCFDLLYPGHLALLRHARTLGEALVVCLRSDTAVRRLKGPGRPVVPAVDRARLLAELESVDAVVTCEDSFPATVLDRLGPDIWVEGRDRDGADLPEADLPEAEIVRRSGGEVVRVPPVDGYSTTKLLHVSR